MMSSPWGQDGYGLRFEWGLTGSREVSSARGVLVVVDVLSFTTAVTVATERGVAVYPAMTLRALHRREHRQRVSVVALAERVRLPAHHAREAVHPRSVLALAGTE